MALTGFFCLITISYIFEGNKENIIMIDIKIMVVDISLSNFVLNNCSYVNVLPLYKLTQFKKSFHFILVIPIFGILQTMIIFNEIPTINYFVGALIVIVSIYLLNKLD